jgi:hypothetical protein
MLDTIEYKIMYERTFYKKFKMLRRKEKMQKYYTPMDRCLYDPENKYHINYLNTLKHKRIVWTFSETKERSEEYYYISGFDTNPEANILGYFVTNKPYRKPIKVDINSNVCWLCKTNVCMGSSKPSFYFRDFFIINNEWVFVEEPTFTECIGWCMDNVMDKAFTLYPKGFDRDDMDSFHMGGYENDDVDSSHIKNPNDYDLTEWGGKCMSCGASN